MRLLGKADLLFLFTSDKQIPILGKFLSFCSLSAQDDGSLKLKHSSKLPERASEKFQVLF